MVVGPAAPPLLDQAAARQQIARWARGGPIEVRGSALQPLQQHSRPPARVRLARRTDPLRHVRRDAVWAVMRCPTAIAQCGASALLHAVDPLVAGLPAHMVAPTQLGHRSEEHTSELQSRLHLVCRLLLEKKKNKN